MKVWAVFFCGLCVGLPGCTMDAAADLDTWAAAEDCSNPSGGNRIPRFGSPRFFGRSHTTYREVPLDQIANTHFLLDAPVERLVESIRTNGFDLGDEDDGLPRLVELPVEIRGSARYLISNGHHRVAAMRALGEESIPAEVWTKADVTYVAHVEELVRQATFFFGELTQEEHDAILRALHAPQ